LQWGELPAGKRDLLEAHDNFAPLRNAFRRLSAKAGEWAGVPMPLDGERLSIAPGYPFREALEPHDDDDEPLSPGERIRNSWYSKRLRMTVVIYERDGKIERVFLPGMQRLTHDLHTLGASFAWGVEQESRALQTLATLVKHNTFKQYLLTGTFLETSKRSGLVYLFRKLRPTVALRIKGEHIKALCALCMHPVAYYEDSWGGAMCPTDDVIAHLMMVRGDEPLFWKRCNQHDVHRPEAGL
jgi:hypothetical protein